MEALSSLGDETVRLDTGSGGGVDSTVEVGGVFVEATLGTSGTIDSITGISTGGAATGAVEGDTDPKPLKSSPSGCISVSVTGFDGGREAEGGRRFGGSSETVGVGRMSSSEIGAEVAGSCVGEGDRTSTGEVILSALRFVEEVSDSVVEVVIEVAAFEVTDASALIMSTTAWTSGDIVVMR